MTEDPVKAKRSAVRVLKNIGQLLEQGTYPGELAPILLEAQQFTGALLKETEDELDLLKETTIGSHPGIADLTPASEAETDKA